MATLFRQYVILMVILLLANEKSQAQIDDIGLWVGTSFEKKITRKILASFTEQLRLNHDISTVDVLISDIAMEYSLSKKLKAAIHYRFMNSNKENYYSKRHRFYLDASYKQKVKFVSITFRERIQEQYSDIYSSEDGKYPEWNLRSKITIKFELDKKYSPYLSTEVFYKLDNVKERGHIFTTTRYEAGFSYDFNRTHSINPYILFQHERSSGFNELIYGLSYDFVL